MPKVTIPDACIFCGCAFDDENRVTDEHYFPRKWVQRLSGITRGDKLTMQHRRGGEGFDPGPDDEFARWWKAREADLYVQCVCEKCNSEWMNVMDEQTFPTLDRLVLGERHRFGSIADQTLIAAWVTKVALMADFKQLPAIVPATVQQTFHKTKRAPTHAWIGLACAERDAEFRASAFTWTLLSGDVPELYVAIVRVQHFVAVFALPLVAKEMGGNRSRYGSAMQTVWPPQVETYDWPLPMLSQIDYFAFCNSFVESYKQFGL